MESKTQKWTVEAVPSSLKYSKVVPIAAQSPKPLGYYHIIEERGLFPKPEVVKKEEDLSSKKRLDMGDSLPKTPLQLQLKGTVVGDDTSYSWAVIEDMTTRKQDLYKVGDVISGAKIIEIYRNRVILNRDGKEEILMVFDEDKVARLVGSQPVQPVPLQQPPSPPKPPDANSSQSRSELVPTKVGENRWVFNKDDINTAVNNANQILSEVNIAPYFEDGAAKGYKVENFREGSLFGKAGFKSGDIVKRVNGMSIETPEQLIQAYQKLKDAANIQVDVERNGNTVTLDYQINR
jgi:general secretion pathway protein C